MRTKDVLSEVVNELERTEALIATLQEVLLSNNILEKTALDPIYLKNRKEAQGRLLTLRVAISELPDLPE